MIKQIAIATITLLTAIAMPTMALAETVMEKVARTGVLTAGTRSSAIPLAYTNNGEEWVGLSVDLLLLIRE
jgi:polar amino acid transport system substrate-binding protein